MNYTDVKLKTALKRSSQYQVQKELGEQELECRR